MIAPFLVIVGTLHINLMNQVNGNNVQESHLFLVGTLHRLKTEQVKIAHACWHFTQGVQRKAK